MGFTSAAQHVVTSSVRLDISNILKTKCDADSTSLTLKDTVHVEWMDGFHCTVILHILTDPASHYIENIEVLLYFENKPEERFSKFLVTSLEDTCLPCS
ncbi:unnamed protein product [Choristocarpus tenellus]